MKLLLGYVAHNNTTDLCVPTEKLPVVCAMTDSTRQTFM